MNEKKLIYVYKTVDINSIAVDEEMIVVILNSYKIPLSVRITLSTINLIDLVILNELY